MNGQMQDLYSRIRRASAGGQGQVPAGELTMLSKDLAAAIESPAPNTVAQKRAFVQVCAR